jgi:dephospho-CoA kinase
LLRVGLTGGLGSGKSTAARFFAELGAKILSADEIGRVLMQPGQDVYKQILEAFGPEAALLDGELNRPALARLVFQDPAALHRLNCIVHPAVIAEQQRQMDAIGATAPHAIVIVESALIFEVERDNTARGWLKRFDKLILVTAPDELKIARYLARRESQIERETGGPPTPEQLAAGIADARQRLAAQMPDEEKAPRCDFILENTGTPTDLEAQVRAVYIQLGGWSKLSN